MDSTELPAAGDEQLGALRRAAQDVFDERHIRDLDATLTQLVSAAVAAVPGATEGAISRTETGQARVSHATSHQVHLLDQRQSELGEGPCLDAANGADGSAVVVHDLAGADTRRWPRFAPAAVESGFRSMLSTHLGTRAGGPRGALNLYAREPDAFPAHSWITAGLFSLQAATVLYGADEAHLLTRALHSRDVVGRAKGILSERFSTGDAEAFRMLVDAAQDTRLELAEVAAWLCAEAEDRHRARRDTTPRRLTAER